MTEVNGETGNLLPTLKLLKMVTTSTSARRTRAARNASGCPSPSASEHRKVLIETHLPHVRFIAERLAARLPPSVDKDDLIGAGLLGLLDAVDRYDPSRGVMFKTYAELRVRGAMLDSLRDLDWAPRSIRAHARAVEAVCRQIEQEHGRAAEEEEIATALGISLSEFHALLNKMNGLTVMGIDSDNENELSVNLRQVPDDVGHSPLALYERAEVCDQLTAAIDRLPERDRHIIALYYVEELTMKEIGRLLDVTESRVSQIHTHAVLRLRTSLPAPHASEASV